jgi:hypothetical protein
MTVLSEEDTARGRSTANLVLVAAYAAPLIVMFFVVAASTAHGHMLRAFYYDDFYYYAQIARNIKILGFSSFDGVTHTNGYQPLWMAVLVALSFFTEIRPGPFLVLVYSLCAVLHVVGTIRLRFLLRSLFATSGSIEVAVVFYFFFGILIAVSGMETVLLFATFPFMAAAWFKMVESHSPYAAAKFGALCAILSLSRLDGVILAAILIAVAGATGFTSHQPRSSRILIGLGIAALVCMLPLSCYLLWNLKEFAVPFPVSGLAKSLKTSSGFSWTALSSLVFPHNLLGVILPTGTFILALVALFVKIDELRKHFTALNWFAVGLLLFPPVFFALTALRSDWTVFPWYYYPLILALPFAFIAVADRFLAPSGWPYNRFRWVAAIVAVALATGVSAKTIRGGTIYDELSLKQVDQVASFADTHPGTYGMGDAAGLFGFVIARPIVQLEGLASDARMLGFIERSADLKEVFSAYNIQYYITIRLPPDAQPENGCWRVEEPGNSGPSALKMRGEICSAPVVDSVSEYGGLRRRLLVFRIADETAAGLKPIQ